MFIPDKNAPSQEAVQNVQQQSLFSTVAKTAMSFVGYGLGLKAFRGLSFRANVGIGKLVARLSSPKSQLSKSFATAARTVQLNADKGITRESVKGVTKFVGRLRRSANSAIKRITVSMENAMGPLIKEGRYSNMTVRKTIDRSRKSLSRWGLGGKETQRFLTRSEAIKDLRFTTILQNTQNFRKTGLAKNVAKLKRDARYASKHSDKSTLSLLFGKATRGQTDTARILRGRAYGYGVMWASMGAFDYGMYNLMMPQSDKKWYNPKKVAEWGMFSVISDLAFRGAIPRTKAMYHGTSGLIKKALKTDDVGKKFVTSIMSRVEKIAHSTNAHAFTKALDKMTTYGEHSNPGQQFVKRVQGFTKEFNVIRRSILQHKRKITGGEDVYNETLSFLKGMEKQMGKSKAGAIKRDTLRSLEKATDANDPNKWARRINEITGTSIRSTTKTISVDGKQKDIFRGSGFINMDGKNYDISNIMPRRLFNKAFSFMHDNFQMLGFKPLSIFGLKPHIDASANRFSLYTRDNHSGLVHINVGYDQRAIKMKLGNINTQKEEAARRILAQELGPDHDITKQIVENMDDIVSGKYTKYGTPKDRQLMQQLSSQSKDLENANDFVETYLKSREVSGADIEEASQQLKRGFVKLQDNEHVLFSGDKAYYGVRDGKNFNTYQLGYDANKGQYHQFVQIERHHAGGMINLLANMKGYRKDWAVDAEGRLIRSGGGSSNVRLRRIVDPNAGPLRKLQTRLFDTLEIGNKPERSIVGMASDYITKLFHPKTIRNLQFMSTNQADNFVEKITKSGELNAFIGRMHTVTREADTLITNKLVRKHNFIEAINAHAMSHATKADSMINPLSDFFEAFKTGDMFIRPNAHIDDVTFNKNIRKNATRLKTSIKTVFNQNATDYGPDAFSSREVQFLNKVINNRDPISFLAEAYSGKVVNKDAYNNIVFRTYFNALDHANQGDMVEYLQSLPKLSKMKKDLNMIGMMPMIDTYSNISLDPSRVGEKTMMMLGQNTIESLNKNPGAVNRLIDHAEPLWKPSNLHDNISYPIVGYQPVNITLSKNTFVTPEGATGRLYSMGEQLMGSSRNAIGEASESVVTTSSMAAMQALNAINNTGNMLGIGFNPDSIRTATDFGKRVLMKRILPAMGLAAAYRTTDAFFDESGLFEGTQLGEGLSAFGASMIGQSRLAIAGVNDAVGVTAMSKYLEDVMPGFVNSPMAHMVRGVGGPLAGLGVGFKFGGPTGGLIGGSIGAAFSIMSSGGPFGMIGKFDITKSRSELIEEYSGRRQTPVYKGCLPEDEPITIRRLGYIIESKIGDVIIGDEVLTKSGRWEVITNIIRRSPDHLYIIKTNGLGNLAYSRTSGNHLIYATNNIDTPPDYIRADAICKKAYLAYELPPDRPKSTAYINLIPFITQCKKFNMSPDSLILYDAKVYQTKRHANAYDISYINKHSYLPPILYMTMEIGLLFGWWLTEGSYHSKDNTIGGIEFALCDDEKHVTQELDRIMYKHFGVTGTTRPNSSEHGIKYVVTSELIGTLFYSIFGDNKDIPQWMYECTTDAFYVGLLGGLIDGDGHVNKSKYTMTFKSCRYSIAHLCWTALQYINIIAAFSHADNNKLGVYIISIQNKNSLLALQAKIPPSYKLGSGCIKYSRTKRYKYTNIDGWVIPPSISKSNNTLYIPISSITQKENDLDVIDITVENDPSFTRTYVTYHNSGWLLGMGPVGGTRIERFEPNWFQQMTSQYKHTDVLYGSKMERLLAPFDMNHYFEKHKVTRPYPVTENVLSGTPLLGNVIGFGGSLANEEEIKYAAYAGAMGGGNLNLSSFDFDAPQGIREATTGSAGTPNVQNLFSPRYESKLGVGGGYLGPPAIMPNSFAGRTQAAYAQLTDFMGLRGFVSETVFNNMNDGLMPYEDIPKLESASWMTSPFRHYWDANLGDMFGCFLGSTKITTQSGTTNIKDVKVGAKVFSNGVFRIVKGKTQHENKPIWSLTIPIIDEILEGTAGHKIPIYSFYSCHDKNSRACVPNTRNHCRKCTKLHKQIEHKDVMLKDISPGDFVIKPINQMSEDIKSLDMSDFSSDSDVITNKYIYYNNTSKHRVMAWETSECFTRADIRNQLISDGVSKKQADLIAKDTIRYRRTGKRLYRYKRNMLITNDTLNLIGWYIAEGDSEACGRICLTLNSNEYEVALRLQKIIKNELDTTSSITNLDSNTIKLRFSHKGFASLLRFLCGLEASVKYIHPILQNLPKERLSYLFKGITEGDGWLSKDKLKGGFTSASRQLTIDTFNIGLKLGFLGHLTLDYEQREKPGKLYPQGTPKHNTVRHYIQWAKSTAVDMLNSLYGYNIEPVKRSNKGSFILNSNLYIQIKSPPRPLSNVETVYDISIEGVSYYCANQILVHNSNELVRRFIPKHGKHVNEVNPLPNTMPNWLANSNDLWDLSKGDPYCVHPNTLIETDDFKLIEAHSVTRGVNIRNIDSNLVPVSEERTRSLNGENAYEVKVATLAAFQTITSSEHPFWTNRNNGEWVKIKDLSTNDFIGYPIPTLIQSDNTIDAGLLVSYKYYVDEDFIYTRCSNHSSFPNAISIAEKYQEYKFDRGELKHILKVNNLSRKQFENAQTRLRDNKQIHRLPRHYSIDNDLGIIIGYYLSEGYVTDDLKKVGFAFHKDEENTFVAELQGAIKRKFNKTGTIYYPKDTNGIQFIVGSSILAHILEYLCGHGFANKIMSHDLIYSSESIIKNIIRTCINGDGSYFFDSHKFVCSLKLVNTQLLYQIRQLLLAYDIVSSIQSNYLKLSGTEAIRLVEWLTGDIHTPHNISKNVPWFINDKYLYMKVRKVYISEYSDAVHGYQIDDGESFCVAGMLTHNTSLKKGELRLPGCITPDTLFMTNVGMIPANEIQIDMSAITLNKSAIVTKVITREIDEMIYNIRAYHGDNVKLTGDHPILCFRTNKCKYYKSGNTKRRPCKPFCNTKFCSKLKCNDNMKYMAEWIPAKDIIESDFLIVPKVQYQTTCKHIDTKEVLHTKNIVRTNTNTYRLQRKTKHGTTICTGIPITFQDRIEITEDLMYVFGVYLAEGSISNKDRISFTMNITERHILEHISNIITNTFGIYGQITDKLKYNENAVVLTIQSKILHDLFDNILGRSCNKHIPLGFPYMEHLLGGLVDGDGHKSKESAELTVAHKYKYRDQVSTVALACEMPVTTTEHSTRNVTTFHFIGNKIWNYTKLKIPSRLTNNKTSTITDIGKYYITKIHSIKTEPYKGIVYDFTIAGEHNYMSSFIMHNSGYEATHDVKFRFPLEAEYMGMSMEEQVAALTGNYIAQSPDEKYDKMMRGPIAQQVAEQLSLTNQNVTLGRTVFDVQKNMSGKLDIVVGGQPTNVRVVSHATFTKIGTQPLPKDAAELNASLNMGNMRYGTVMYYDAETGNTKTTTQYNDARKFYGDMAQLQGAKGVADEAVHKFGPGIGFNMANAYSRLDRLRILSDVSPFSEEYKQTLREVRSQKKAGLLSKWDEIQLSNLQTQREQVMDRYITHDYKFNRGTPVTDQEREYQDYVSSNYNAVERMAGSVWESFCFAENTQIITHTGAKYIQNVSEHDMTISEDGHLHPIDMVSIRDVAEHDTMVKIVTKHNKNDIIVSINHEVKAVKNKICFCKTNTGIHTKHMYANLCPKCASELKVEYMKVSDLVPGDMTALKIMEGRNITDHLDLSELLVDSNLTITDQFIQSPTNRGLKVNRFIHGTNNVASMYRLFGYFAAEGGLDTNRRISFTLHSNEENTIGADIINILSSVLYIPIDSIKTKLNLDKHTFQISINSLVLRELFDGFGKKGYKRIPPQILPENHQYIRHLLCGFIKGDGYINQKRMTFAYGLCSAFLGYQIRSLLATVGIPTTYGNYKNGLKKDGTTKTKHQFRTTDMPNVAAIIQILDDPDKSTYGRYISHSGIVIVDRYMLFPIRYIHKTNYTGKIYDLKIREVHSYSLMNWTVHNSHMQTPIHTKLLNIASPLEQYERNELYGRQIRDWGQPYNAFIRPYATSMMSRRSPVSGAMSFGMGGFIFGGPVGGVVGAATGAAYGAINPGWGTIPGYRERERKLTGQMDVIRYQKARQVYEATGSIQAKRELERTLSYQYGHATNVQSMFGSVPRHERGFVRTFATAGTAEDRQRIAELMPDYVQPILEKAWTGNMPKPNAEQNIMESYENPNPEWKGWNANISSDDITVKMFERACLTIDQTLFSWYNCNVEYKDILHSKIMDGDGNMKTPIAIYPKEYKGEILDISFKGHYRNIRITPEHIVPLKKRNTDKIETKRVFKECKIGEAKQYDQMLVSGLNLDESISTIQLGTHSQIIINELFGYFIGIFLAEGSFVKKKRLTKDSIPMHVINANISKGKVLEYIYNNEPSFPRDISKNCNINNTTLSKYLSDLVDKNYILKSKGNHITTSYTINRTKTLAFEIEQEHQYEEYKSGLQISLHEDEGYIANTVEKLCDSLLISYGRYPFKNKKAFNLIIYSEDLANLVYDLVGEYSHEKYISDKILSFPINVIKNIIQGYFIGDGDVISRSIFHNVTETSTYSINTVSEILANHIWILLRTFGIRARIYKYEYKANNKKTNFRVSFSDKKSVKLFNSLTWIKQKDTPITIDNIRVDHYEGKIFDITMPNNHFYMVGPVIVHNSLDAHDVGLGWSDQIRRMKYTSGIPESFSDTVQSGSNIAINIRNIVQSMIPGADVKVLSTSTPGITVTVV